MIRKEIIFQGGYGAIGDNYLELQIKYYIFGILIYSITKTEKE